MIENFNEIIESYVEETAVDYVGLWQIIMRVRYKFRIVEHTQLKKAVLQIIRGLLSAGLEAIILRTQKPVRLRWENQDCEYVIDRISKEWDLLERDPYPGEIVWFDRKRD